MPERFDPGYGQAAWAWELIAGVPQDSGRIDFDFSASSGADTPTSIERTEILPGGESPEKLPSKRTPVLGYTIPNVHPETSWLPFFALIGKAAAGVEVGPASGYYLHTVALDESDLTAPGSLTGYVFKDDGQGVRFLESRVQSTAISFGQGASISQEVTLIPGRADYWGDPVRTGTGTAKLAMRGICDLNFVRGLYLLEDNSDLFVKVISSTGTTVTVQVKLGTGGVYSADQVLTKAAWNWIGYGADLIMVGNRADKGELYVPSAGTYVADDVYRIPRRRVTPVKSAPDPADVVVEVYSSAEVDGQEFRLTQGTTTLEKTGVTAEQQFGGRQAARTVSRGFLKPTLTFQRQYLDIEFLHALEMGRTFSFRLDLYARGFFDDSGLESARVSLFGPKWTPEGSTPTVQGAAEMSENITATAAPDGATPAFTVEVVNTQSSLPVS